MIQKLIIWLVSQNYDLLRISGQSLKTMSTKIIGNLKMKVNCEKESILAKEKIKSFTSYIQICVKSGCSTLYWLKKKIYIVFYSVLICSSNLYYDYLHHLFCAKFVLPVVYIYNIYCLTLLLLNLV